jgi:hypothetical protein
MENNLKRIPSPSGVGVVKDLENNIKYTVVYDIETLSNCFTYTAIDRY